MLNGSPYSLHSAYQKLDLGTDTKRNADESLKKALTFLTTSGADAENVFRRIERAESTPESAASQP